MPKLGFFGKNFFDLMDFAASNILLPLGGFFIAIFVGWSLKKRITVKELTSDGSQKFTGLRIFYFLIRYIAPTAILIVFIAGLFN
jgi:NSS family neurotransmitter:Na+ symporter